MIGGGHRVLVVTDCDGTEETVNDLRRHGFDPVHVTTAAETMVAHRTADIVFVDLDLAEFDGLTLCRELRAVSDIPMIGFASFSQLERVLALEAGCDDCVDKPYHSRELVARLGAVLRRAKVLSPPTITFGELRIHPTLREVRVGDRLVETTRKEFELLHLLATEPDKVFTRAELLRRVWGYDSVESDVTPLASRTIDTHVSSLRRKLGASHWIVTVRGVGFRFTDVGGDDDPDGGVDAAEATASPTAIPLSG